MSDVLSARGERWLATLAHEPAIATSEVERLIVDAGHVAHGPWLAFHERFAGYCEEVGPGDVAFWGLASTRGVWTKPGTIWVRPKQANPVYGGEEIRCADANPVHGYELAPSGAFAGLGGPCPSFAMKVERHGLLHDLYARGSVKRTVTRGAMHEELVAPFLDDLVSEASSKSTKFYARGDVVLEHVPGITQLVRWEISR